MAAFKHVPGNANLPIGAPKDSIQEHGVSGRLHFPANMWQSRGYLPHFESADSVQHVTFHLADSLPHTILRQLESSLKALPKDKRDVQRRRRADDWIDAGHGSCVLRNPLIADMAQASLLSFDSRRYRLLAWVVMPNHIHVLFQPMPRWTVAKIVASWKKFTARKICDHLQDAGEARGAPIWHREYWDRYIRDQAHLDQAIAYIHQNPVKAGLAISPEIWPWSSAHFAASTPGNANLPIGASKYAVQENGVPSRKP